MDRDIRALLALGDMTGDGKPDLVTCSQNRLRFLSATDGALGLKIVGRFKDIDFAHNVIVIPDIDGDDCRDLAVHSKTDHGGGSIVTLYSSATGRALRFIGRARRLRSGFERTLPQFTRLSIFEERDERDRVPSGAMAVVDYEGRAALALVAQPWNRRWEKDSFELWMVVLETFEAIYVGRTPGPAWNMVSIPDLDGDGQDDLALTRDSEWLRVVDGSRGRKLFEFSYRGGWMHGEGTSLAVLPDVDGDGLPDLLEAGNEAGLDCDGGAARVISGGEGEPLWWIRFPGSVAPHWKCGIGIDAAAHPIEGGVYPHGILLHMPRLEEVWRVDAQSGETLWRVAYDVGDGVLEVVEPALEGGGVLITSDR